MIVTSAVTGIEYEQDNTVKIFNSKQIAKYLKHGAMIVDAGVDSDCDTFYIIFDKKECSHLFDKWCRHEL